MGKDLHSFEKTQKLILFLLGEYAAPYRSAGGNVPEFGKACGLIPFGIVPFVKALFGYMPAVLTVYEAAFPVVTPGPCQKDGAVGDCVLTGETAVVENKADLLFQAVSGCRSIAVTPYIIYGADLAAVKQCVSAAEDEIHVSCNKAVSEDLFLVFLFAKLVL